MGFTIRLEDGRHVTNYCEGFNDQTRFELVRAVAARDRPDIVVAGAQLDYPAQVAEAAAILNPRRLVLFHPHTDYFAFIDLASRPPAVRDGRPRCGAVGGGRDGRAGAPPHALTRARRARVSGAGGTGRR